MNEYNLVFMSNDTIFNKKWFTFYTPPITGDLIDLSSFLNVKYDKEDYVKIIARIHVDKRCFLKVEPNL